MCLSSFKIYTILFSGTSAYMFVIQEEAWARATQWNWFGAIFRETNQNLCDDISKQRQTKLYC